jgi:YD repeat-containing protein
VTSYTEGTTTFTVTYGAFGVDTISGGGKVRTVARNASGQITGVTDA